jgi:ketosteroid isomerase-like protein
MAQDNVERCHAAYDAFNRRDWRACLELHAADVEITPLAAPVSSTYQGSDGMRRYWRDLIDHFPDFTTEPLDIRAIGDLTVSEVRFRGRGAGSDAPFEQVVWQLAQWRRGQIAWWRSFRTEAEALAFAEPAA